MGENILQIVDFLANMLKEPFSFHGIYILTCVCFKIYAFTSKALKSE